MKSVVIWLLLSCVSLISAKNYDFFANGTKSNIFAPLNEFTRNIIFTEVLPFADDILNKTSKLDAVNRSHIWLKLSHNAGPSINAIDLNLRDATSSDKSYINREFVPKMQMLIDYITDLETLFTYSIKLKEKADKLPSNFSLDVNEKYKYMKFTDYSNQYARHFDYMDLVENIVDGYYNGIIYNLMDIMKINACTIKQSQSQMLANFLGHLTLREIQVYLMVLNNDEIYKTINRMERSSMKYKIKMITDNINEIYYPKIYKKIKQFMTKASQEVWRCDPIKHIEDVTYTKLEGSFKEYSKEEKDLNCDISYKPICHNLTDTSDRYINLKPVLSNVYNNSVITGVQLVKKNHTIHIQIQEGQLLPNGSIDTSTIIWAPIKEDTACDCYVLKWNGRRSIDLNDVLVPEKPHSVLTGISFDTFKNGYDERLQLVIYSTPFNFNTGKLDISDANPWKKLIPEPANTAFKYSDVQVPAGEKIIPDLYTNQTLTFTTSTSRKEDGHTIPFIDIQPVETVPPTPMSGAGIFYKGSRSGYGLLKLKLFTYNIQPHLKQFE